MLSLLLAISIASRQIMRNWTTKGKWRLVSSVGLLAVPQLGFFDDPVHVPVNPGVDSGGILQTAPEPLPHNPQDSSDDVDLGVDPDGATLGIRPGPQGAPAVALAGVAPYRI